MVLDKNNEALKINFKTYLKILCEKKCEKQAILPKTFTQNDTFYDNDISIASGFN